MCFSPDSFLCPSKTDYSFSLKPTFLLDCPISANHMVIYIISDPPTLKSHGAIRYPTLPQESFHTALNTFITFRSDQLLRTHLASPPHIFTHSIHPTIASNVIRFHKNNVCRSFSQRKNFNGSRMSQVKIFNWSKLNNISKYNPLSPKFCHLFT